MYLNYWENLRRKSAYFVILFMWKYSIMGYCAEDLGVVATDFSHESGMYAAFAVF
jgi:hypothetical protein